MRTRHADRFWIIGGILGAALLVVASWFLAISPQYAEASSLKQQTSDTEVRLIQLRKRLTQLQDQASKLASYEAALRTNRAALPTDSGVPDFLRQLQLSGDKVGVNVSGVTVSAPTPDSNLPTVYSLPITLTADGTADGLDKFLNELQTVQPRAVFIESANFTAGDADSSISIILKAFVASGGTAPAVAPK